MTHLAVDTRGDAPSSAAVSLQRLTVGALLAYLVFVVYGSLVPLNFQPLALCEAWVRFQQAPLLQLGMASRADLVANLLLFIPLAWLMRESLATKRPPGLLLTAALWLLCVCLAIAIEFTQEFFPGRTVSLNDPLAESAGAALGLLLHHFRGPSVHRWLAGWWLAEQAQPFARRLLHGYLVLLLVFALMPLDLSFNPADLYQKFKQGRLHLLPLADLPADPAQAAYDLLTDVLVWLPVGLLWRIDGRLPLQVLLRGWMLAALLELLQLFVFTRVTSLTDVLSGGLGCWIGALCLPAVWRAAPDETAGMAAGTQSALRSGWIIAWAVAVPALFWYPYQADWSGAFLAERWQQAFRVPFATYYMGSEYHALNELLRKLLVFLPGGLLWAYWTAAAPAWRQPALHRTGAVGALVMAMLVETGQLVLPGKVADLTDLALETAGALVGLALGRRLFGRTQGPLRAAPPTVPVARAGAVDLAAVLVVAGLLWVLSRQSGVPYNIKELLGTGVAGAAVALSLAATLWWLLTLPLLLLARWRRAPWRAIRLALWSPLLGLPCGLLLLATAPRESLHDIVGSPVWGGLDEAELLVRFMGLYAALALAAIGAVWTVVRVASERRIGLLPGWFVAVVLWAVPLHALVVGWAATDNLTELMRDGGGPLASAFLFCGVYALLVFVSACVALLARAPHPGRMLVLAVLAWPAALAALWFGSEPLLIKYDRVFSAAQFLLSADRDHYAAGPALLWRYALACIALVLLATLLQWVHWRRCWSR